MYNIIKKQLLGYTKNEFEKIFEQIILPIYLAQCSLPNIQPNYKITNRATGEEYTDNNPMKTLKKLGFI